MKDFNLKKGWAVARLNLRSLAFASAVMLAIFAIGSIPQIILNIVGGNVESLGISTWLYTFALVFPILLATINYSKTMHLGAKKKDYFCGALIFLAILSAIISFASILTYYAIDKPITDNLAKFYSLYKVFGFSTNGIIIGFLQQFGFVFLLSILIFLFASMQDNWKGWIASAGIVVIITITLLVDVLREYIWQKGLIYLTIKGSPIAQICFVVFGGMTLYFVYLLMLKRKKI